MAKIVYTYQTNSFKIIKSTFSIYDLPHAPIIFLINLGTFNCFENLDRAENFRQTVPIYGWWGGGCPPAPPEFPPLTLSALMFYAKHEREKGRKLPQKHLTEILFKMAVYTIIIIMLMNISIWD